MEDTELTREQLLAELSALRQKIAEMEQREAVLRARDEQYQNEITERRQAEEALAIERNLLRTLIDNMPDYIFIKDAQSRFLVGNLIMAVNMGAANGEELVGKTDFDYYPEELARGYYEDEQSIIRSGRPLINREELNKDKEGNWRWFLTTKVPTRDRSGNVTGIVGMGRDITHIKKVEATLAKRAAELATVAEVSTAVSANLEPQQILQTVVDLTKERFNLYHAHIYLLDGGGKELMLAAGAGEVGLQMVSQGWQIPISREQSLVARAARTRRGVIVNDVRSEQGFLPNILLPDTRAEMAVPLIVGDTLIGVLDVQSDEVNHFTDEDVSVHTTLAAQVAVALQNARTYAQTQRQAEYEAMINAISQKIQTTTTVEAALQVAVRELGRALGAPRTSVQLSLQTPAVGPEKITPA